MILNFVTSGLIEKKKKEKNHCRFGLVCRRSLFLVRSSHRHASAHAQKPDEKYKNNKSTLLSN